MTALIGLRRRPSASRKSTRATIMGDGPRNTAAMADQDKKDSGIKALGDARNRPVPPIPDRETVLADLLKRVPALTRERAIEELEAMGL